MCLGVHKWIHVYVSMYIYVNLHFYVVWIHICMNVYFLFFSYALLIDTGNSSYCQVAKEPSCPGMCFFSMKIFAISHHYLTNINHHLPNPPTLLQSQGDIFRVWSIQGQAGAQWSSLNLWDKRAYFPLARVWIHGKVNIGSQAWNTNTLPRNKWYLCYLNKLPCGQWLSVKKQFAQKYSKISYFYQNYVKLNNVYLKKIIDTGKEYQGIVKPVHDFFYFI